MNITDSRRIQTNAEIAKVNYNILDPELFHQILGKIEIPNKQVLKCIEEYNIDNLYIVKNIHITSSKQKFKSH